MAEHPDLLVALLPILARLDHRHDEVLRCHEGQLLLDPPLDHLRVDNQPLGDVLQGGEDGVGGEEGLGQGDPAVGGVVEGALHPLDALGGEDARLEAHQVARQATHLDTWCGMEDYKMVKKDVAWFDWLTRSLLMGFLL